MLEEYRWRERPGGQGGAQVRKRGSKQDAKYLVVPRRKRCLLGGCAREAWLQVTRVK